MTPDRVDISLGSLMMIFYISAAKTKPFFPGLLSIGSLRSSRQGHFTRLALFFRAGSGFCFLLLLLFHHFFQASLELRFFVGIGTFLVILQLLVDGILVNKAPDDELLAESRSEEHTSELQSLMS